VGSAVLLTLLASVSTTPLEAPYEGVRSPLAMTGLPAVVEPLRSACALGLGLGLLTAAASLVVRFRRSRGVERRQLLWLMIAAVPAPLFVGLAFGGSMADHRGLTLLGTAGFVSVLPVAAGLAVLRYRLYDVDRVLTATAVYSLLTAGLVATYAVVVWLGAELGTRWGAGPVVSATAGAVAAAAVAAPLRRVIQTMLDRRFNRRAYDARQVVRAGLAEEDAGIDLTRLFRQAFRDDSVSVAYPADDSWVTPDGAPAAVPAAAVSVTRHGRVVARVGFDPARVAETTVARTAAMAATELDNGRLRAEVARRLEEIDASRRRLTTAQRTERRRIERDLHDGAQQSLLALAFDLQSAQVNGEPDRMRDALAAGAASARNAVRELRELANGLHPAALVDGGLSAALDDMARHSPVPVRLDVTPDRLDPALEFTAWLVLGEAVVNAQKHAGAAGIDVAVSRQNGHLRLRVSDDGRGGARPDGPGLRGLRDRVETAQGELVVRSSAQGTTIEAVLPCGS
jgi:signal transduction histidine kinase